MTPSENIDQLIKNNKDWRGEALFKIRKIILSTDPEIIEEWKWRGVPVWYKDGMICTCETYMTTVKMTFARGAELDDHTSLFNSSLDGKVRRAIDFHEGDLIDKDELKSLILTAINLNKSKLKK